MHDDLETRHFTPEELSHFLEQLSLDEPSPEDGSARAPAHRSHAPSTPVESVVPQRSVAVAGTAPARESHAAQPDLPAPSTEPVTVIGDGRDLPVGAPQLRLARGRALVRGLPESSARIVRASSLAAEGHEGLVAPEAALRETAQRKTAQHGAARHETAQPETSARIGARRARPRRTTSVTWVLIPLLLLGLIGCLWLGGVSAREMRTAHAGPPPLPVVVAPAARAPLSPSAADAPVAVSPSSASTGPAAGSASPPSVAPVAVSTSSPSRGPAAGSASPRSVAPVSVSPSSRSTEPVAGSASPPSAVPVPSAAPRRVAPKASLSRRKAVDLLLSGRTRAALDAYRALALDASDDLALVQVVRLLERELRACAAKEDVCDH